MWMDIAATGRIGGADMVTCFWNLIRKSEAERDNKAVAAAAERLGKEWADGPEKVLAKTRFLGGDELTMGDIPLGCFAVSTQSLMSLQRTGAVLCFSVSPNYAFCPTTNTSLSSPLCFRIATSPLTSPGHRCRIRRRGSSA